MGDLVRAATLMGYTPVMQALGIDPRPLIKEVGLSDVMLQNPEQLISALAVCRLLERSAAISGCATLGLRMAAGRPITNLGVSSLLIAHQPTLREGLRVLGEYRARVNSVLLLHIEEEGNDVILREDFSLSQPEPHRQSSNLAMGVLARLCSDFLGEAWHPHTACFSHEHIPASELPIFTQLFGCRPEFNCEFNGIVLNSADLDRPNAKADMQMAEHARQLLQSVIGTDASSTAQEVEQVVRLLLPSGRATIQSCAATMGTTVRTLQRQLDSEGETFSAVLNHARKQLAIDYLSNPRVSITDISNMLGYSSIGAFTRWFTDSFATSPRKWRQSKMM